MHLPGYAAPFHRATVGPTVDLRHGPQVLDLVEISGATPEASAQCRLSLDGDDLVISVEAADPDMTQLVATAPRDGVVDRMLYEEDVLQVVIAPSGCSPDEISGLLLINPMDNRFDHLAAAHWTSRCTRHADGWSIVIKASLPANTQAIGLSLHRYFRGVHHEVTSLTPVLPHPLEPTSFAVLIVAGDAPAMAQAEAMRAEWRKAAAEWEAQKRATTASRIEAGVAKGEALTLDHCRALAEARAQEPVAIDAGHASWNESHFQHALLDLWHLDGDRRWLTTAIERMRHTLANRADKRGAACMLWGEPLATWHGDNNQYGRCLALVTGVITSPIARMLRLLHETDQLAELRQGLEHWPDLLHESIDLHDREWLALPDAAGVYLEPHPKGPQRIYPTGGSRFCPLNRAFFLGMTMLDLWHVTRRDADLAKVRAMARFFRLATEQASNGSLVWEYEATRYPAGGEDHSHAQAQVRFALMLAEADIEFSQADLDAMACTLERNILRYPDAPCSELRGHNIGMWWDLSVWMQLLPRVPHLLPHCETLLRAALGEGKFDFTKQGWGVRNLTEFELARRSVEGV